MADSQTFGLVVLAVSAAALAAVQSHGLSERLRIPTPAFFLVGAALAVELLPGVEAPDHLTVERIVTVALIVLLFDGGMHIGARRARASANGILSLGVLGTFATAAGAAVVAHLLLGGSWYVALLVGTAIAPTDPAVVFSVLGRREVEGRSGTVLEGESGANDPVGIALLAALLGAGALSGGALLESAGTFLVQMCIGAVVGVGGGRLLLFVMRRWALPAEGLYPVRTLVGAGIVFGAAAAVEGSGFLAVFVAGIVIGDERAPYKREVERFHSALASLGEVVAFGYLGLTVDFEVLSREDVWVPGLVLGLLLATVLRPLLAGPFLLPAGLSRGESAFVLLAGLKGAVPLLLGSMLVVLPDGDRLYGVVIVVVMVSVVLQGALVPTMARVCGVRMTDIPLEPFSLGIRFRDEPRDAHRLTIAEGAVADGLAVEKVPGLDEGTWISLLLRDDQLVAVRGDTVLRAGDEVIVLVDAEQNPSTVVALFVGRPQPD